MKIKQFKWKADQGWAPNLQEQTNPNIQLLLLFGSTNLIKNNVELETIYKAFPNAVIWGGTTAGEIYQTEVNDESYSLTAVEFEKTDIKMVNCEIESMDESFNVGKNLADKISKENLKHVLVMSDGLKINGSELVKGLASNLPEDVSITGGLSGDGAEFAETYVFSNNKPLKNNITLLGLYGDSISVGYGSFGGWDPFGPERLITKSDKNILYELDNNSALELYKKYLGEHAKNLPASGLLFPLSIRISDNDIPIVRTILAVDEETESMTFAGDMPEGAYARLMKANFDRLIDGAFEAAKIGKQEKQGQKQLAILISCVGRKMVLKQRVEEEIECVQDLLGDNTFLTGFYSYGEISPFTPNAKCELHNQTMTITTIFEK